MAPGGLSVNGNVPCPVGRANQRTRDGYFVVFWRILTDDPELLARESLWVRSQHELQAEIDGKGKSINPTLPVGRHMWPKMSFSPFFRAEEDYTRLGGYSDFIRPVLCANCAGEGIKSLVESIHGDVPEERAQRS